MKATVEECKEDLDEGASMEETEDFMIQIHIIPTVSLQPQPILKHY